MVSVQVQKSQIPAIKANNSFLIKTNGSLVVLMTFSVSSALQLMVGI